METIIILTLIGIVSALYIAFRIRKSLKNSDCSSCYGSCKNDCKK